MTERAQLEAAMAALEAQRPLLGDAVVEAGLRAMRGQLAQFQPPESDQRKQVTVLFADISGFTAMAEDRDPEEVRDTLHALWQRLDGLIVEAGGRVDKHIGDGVMALFGAPTAQEDDPERAVRAALAIQAALQDMGGATTLPMRIGIHTGPVLLGAIGTTGEYTALGDTVNTASRLERAAPPGGILISHETYRHVRGVFDVQPLDPLEVKGKSEPVRVYLVQRAKPRAFRVPNRGFEGLETRMIGRDAELQRLQDSFSAALGERQARSVTVVGEAGAGKSRLLAEFTDWFELLPQRIWVAKGRADLQTMHLPYALLRDLLFFRFEIRDSDPAAVARARFETGIAAVLGPDSAEAAHFLGHLVGLDFADSPHLAGILADAVQIRDRAFRHAVQFFAAIAARQPAVLLLEDIHWADDGSLDLIAHLDRAGIAGTLLIVALARPTLYERRPGWGADQAGHNRLDVLPLSPADSRRLVAEILRKVPEIPAALETLVVGGAEGNPFYVEELVKMLIDEGVIRTGGDTWEVEPGRLAAARVPPTLTGVLQARLDSLPAAERAMMQRAAVVGAVFWADAVAALADPADGEPPLATVLAGLHGKELIFRRDTTAFAGTSEWTFKHALLHEVAYESVLRRERRTHHRAVAAWLVARSGERADEYAGLIADHWERAGEPAAASDWYARAGRQALDTFSPAAAADFYEKALALLGADAAGAAQRLLLYEHLAEAQFWLARYAEALAAFHHMREQALAAGDQVAEARAWLGLAQTQNALTDSRATLESAAQAETVARAAGADLQRAGALRFRGMGHYRLGEGDAALDLGARALAIATRLGDQREMALDYNLLGITHLMLSHHAEAEAAMAQALALNRALGDRRSMGIRLNNLGEIARQGGEYGLAVERYAESLALALETGNLDLQIYLLSNLGGARVALGQWAAAEEGLRQAIRLAEAAGGHRALAESYSFLAEALLGQGRLIEATTAARQGLAVARGSENPDQQAIAWVALGRVAAALPDPIPFAGHGYDAPACFAEAARISAEIGMEAEQARALRIWAVYAAAHGDPAQAVALTDQARSIFTRLGLTAELARLDSPDSAVA